MKRFIRTISFILALTLSLSGIQFAFASTSTFTLNTPYEFPITPNDPEWKEFETKNDMLLACQIPENILKKITTSALLETVLAYPFLSDYFAFNSYLDAAETFMRDFNGFRELLTRSDLTAVLLSKYSSTPVNNGNVTLRNNSDLSDFFLIPNLEFIIAYDQIANKNYSSSESEQFDTVLFSKIKERNSLGVLSANSEIYLNFINQIGVANSQSATYSTVKTPKGTSVQVMKITPDLTTTEKNNINRQFDTRYPNAVRKGTATTNYNCHSYAWYYQSTSNKYWMNDPSAYMSDGSYKKFTDLRPREGFKAYYYNGNHSAIISTVKVVEGAQTFWYTSKWGSAGLYEHAVYYCPYSTGIRHYYESAT